MPLVDPALAAQAAKAKAYKLEKPQYDTKFTDLVIAATGPKAHPRLAQVMPSLLRHLHDFARETHITVSEWTAAIDFVRQVHTKRERILPTQL